MRRSIRSWLGRTERFWNYVLGDPAPPILTRRIAFERLEDRIVPDSRPLPLP